MRVDDTPVDFESVLRSEHESINRRRSTLRRPPVDDRLFDHQATYDTVGLALSGGGIRSAAISLGALQALNHFSVLRNVDYLSTVSGGGFIGSSLTATMTFSEGKFVFGNQPEIGVADLSEPLDSAAVQHLRNFSNYLMPAERQNIGPVIAIVVRGLVANAAIVLPFLLFFAGMTIWSLPTRSSLSAGVHGGIFASYLPSQLFGVTIWLVLVGLLIFFLWALYLSFLSVRSLSEDGTILPLVAGAYLFILVAVFFLELQPLLIRGKFDFIEHGKSSSALAGLYAALITVATFAVPVGVVVASFRHQIGPALRRADATSNLFISVLGILSKTVIWIAALSLPLWLWIAYLHLAYWGIVNDASGAAPDAHTPEWLSQFATWANDTVFHGQSGVPPVALVFVVLFPLLSLLSGFLKSNALSLHGLYRDRLRKAFLFDPSKTANGEFESLGQFYVSELSAKHAPYHLINAALNIRGSRYANQRGRDADFFVLSPNYTGSRVTGYVPTQLFERAGSSVDLATAMAISGAAVSSSMGAQSIRVLRPTLALLNVRLGYWLPNPRRLRSGLRPRLAWTKRVARVLGRGSALLWSEITGRLYTEWRDEVYVTDGGHIENLGLYELLRRRCRVIVCIDAEADPEIRCNSFIALQRYASIDLGVRIEMPWGAIQSTTRRRMGYDPLWDRESKVPASHGPHAAVGIIHYSGGETGYLLYFKASLTGDENAFVQDYARRYARFPHEGTGNQFFNEEQFEVYRALGFHMVHGALSGEDILVMPDPFGEARFNQQDGAIKILRDALFA